MLDLDEYHDSMLIKYLDDNEKEIAKMTQNQPPVQNAVQTPQTGPLANNTNIQNVLNTNFPQPKMFFTNSSVTINYNFNK